MYDQSVYPKKKLYRLHWGRRFLGVAGGLADYFELPRWLIRFMFIVATPFLGGFNFIIYIALGFALDKEPPSYQINVTQDLETLKREIKIDRRDTLQRLSYRMKKIDEKLRNMENYVTNTSFDLAREIDSLGNGGGHGNKSS